MEVNITMHWRSDCPPDGTSIALAWGAPPPSAGEIDIFEVYLFPTGIRWDKEAEDFEIHYKHWINKTHFGLSVWWMPLDEYLSVVPKPHSRGWKR